MSCNFLSTRLLSAALLATALAGCADMPGVASLSGSSGSGGAGRSYQRYAYHEAPDSYREFGNSIYRFPSTDAVEQAMYDAFLGFKADSAELQKLVDGTQTPADYDANRKKVKALLIRLDEECNFINTTNAFRHQGIVEEFDRRFDSMTEKVAWDAALDKAQQRICADLVESMDLGQPVLRSPDKTDELKGLGSMFEPATCAKGKIRLVIPGSTTFVARADIVFTAAEQSFTPTTAFYGVAAENQIVGKSARLLTPFGPPEPDGTQLYSFVIDAVSIAPGAAGNIKEGTVFKSTTSQPLTTATAVGPFTGGKDRVQRIFQYDVPVSDKAGFIVPTAACVVKTLGDPKFILPPADLNRRNAFKHPGLMVQFPSFGHSKYGGTLLADAIKELRRPIGGPITNLDCKGLTSILNTEYALKLWRQKQADFVERENAKQAK